MLQYPKKTGVCVCVYIYPNLRRKMISILKNVRYFLQNLDHSVHASNQGREVFGGALCRFQWRTHSLLFRRNFPFLMASLSVLYGTCLEPMHTYVGCGPRPVTVANEGLEESPTKHVIILVVTVHTQYVSYIHIYIYIN